MWTRWKTVVAGLLIAGGAWAQEEEAPTLRLVDTNATSSAEAAGALSLSGAVLPELVENRSLNQAFELINGYRYDEAKEIIESVLLRSPDNQKALTGLSIIYTKNYEHQKALEILDSLIERDPNNVAIKNNAAWIYATADDPAVRDGHRAVKLAREALVVAPGSYHIWSTMAEGYYVTGQFTKALETAREAMRMALLARASSDNIREYRSQLQKIQLAVKAFSLQE